MREGPAVADGLLFSRYGDGDLSARDALVARHMPLAQRLTGRYRHSAEQREDLEQVAYVGLLKAIDRYDPAQGPFVGFAVPNILGELKRHFRDRGWALRVTRSAQELALRTTEAVEHLRQATGRSPTTSEIAGHLGVSREQVLDGMEAWSAYSPTSLDAPGPGDPEDGRTLADTLGSRDARFDFVELASAVAPAMRALPEREQEIMRLRFVEDLNQSDIADQIGISQMHVSRLLRRSLGRLAEAVPQGSGATG